jgi:hypothetical protein
MVRGLAAARSVSTDIYDFGLIAREIYTRKDKKYFIKSCRGVEKKRKATNGPRFWKWGASFAIVSSNRAITQFCTAQPINQIRSRIFLLAILSEFV